MFLFPPLAVAIEINAKSAVLMDADSGRVLYEKNAHMRLPQASTTKITSAIIALEKGNRKTKFTAKCSETEARLSGWRQGKTYPGTVDLCHASKFSK